MGTRYGGTNTQGRPTLLSFTGFLALARHAHQGRLQQRRATAKHMQMSRGEEAAGVEGTTVSSHPEPSAGYTQAEPKGKIIYRPHMPYCSADKSQKPVWDLFSLLRSSLLFSSGNERQHDAIRGKTESWQELFVLNARP